MLRFSLYMGDDSRTYRDLVLKLKKPLSFIEARTVVNTIVLLEKENQIVKRDLDNACGSLLQSIGEIEQKN